MPVTRYIESVREKPEHVRRRLAVVWTVVCCAVVAMAWFTNLRVLRTSTGTVVEAPPPAVQAAAVAGSGLDDHWSRIVSGWDKAKQAISDKF